MLTSTLIGAALFVIAVALLQAVSVQRRFSARRQQALLVIQQLFQLLESIPQHRGMSNALLLGNQAFKDKRQAHQQKIDQQLQHISRDHPELAKSPGYLEITTCWNQITRNFASLTAAVSFSKHTLVISKLLELISDIGSQSKLNNSPNQQLKGLLEIGINILPHVTEVLGQARGIGTGAAAQAKLTTQNRSKLSYLHKKASATCANTTTILASQEIKSSALDFSQCQKSMGLFLNTLDRELLSAKVIQIESEHYFAIASDAIGLSFKQLYSLMDEVSSALDKEHAAQRRKQYRCQFFLLLTIPPMVWLLMQLSNG